MNKNKILKMEPEFIKTADSPILFSAFCLEIKKLEEEPTRIIYFPVFIDATCSGIQHLSAMVADSELASLVNLTDSRNKIIDKPEDFYLELVEPINNSINKYGRENPDYKSLINLYFKRKDLKVPIMTQNYNVSIFGMKEQLFNFLSVEEIIIENLNGGLTKEKVIKKIIGYTKEGEKINLNNKDLMKIAMIIKEVIYLKYPVLKEIYNYFINIAELLDQLNLAVYWITPTGAHITQEYKKSTKKKIRIYLHNKYKVNVIKNISDEIDFRKQKDGIIPNVIHSLDSSHIINLINEGNINFEAPIITIHDCFGTHPNYIDILQLRLKEVFINLYIDNQFLNLFHKRIIQYIKDNNFEVVKEKKNHYVLLNNEKLIIPIPPIKNSLDLKNIIYSKYMFN